MKKIFMPEIYKPLIEKFGKLPYCITATSYIYGGAVRDVLAGKEIKGDLDIAVPSSRIETVSLIGTIRRLATGWVIKSEIMKNSPYESGPPISKVIDLENKDLGSVAQIIIAERDPSGRITPAINIVETVDIVCCGVALDCFGYLYEAVPDAIEHCKAHILVATKNANKDRKLYKQRVKKLRDRGWEEV